MQVIIKNPADRDINRLAIDIHLFGYPAMLLDNKGKIIERNIECFQFLSGRAMGVRFSRFLNESDALLVAKLGLGETCYVSFKNKIYPINVGVTRLSFGYLAIFQPLGGGIVKRAEEKCKNLSGYDFISSLPDDIELEFERFSRFSKAVEQLIEGKPIPKRVPIFEPRYYISSLIGEGTSLNLPDEKQINFVSDSNPIAAYGNDLDFVLISAFALSYCLSVATDGVVDASLERSGDDVFLRVSCSKCKENFKLPDYWIRLLRLIADTNLWELLTLCEGERLSFTLKLPYVEFEDKIVLYEKPLDDVSHLLATLFCELISDGTEGLATHENIF